ncbi:MAG TPA: Gfo/Idh/MocA family oxidoreductase [Chitinophagaceae bacterium]|jgi:predicted dehydrogenase|nr:Gfo/Idh/MocA family oxidoreductase [Chitinophagaceae bacterium]
MSATRRQFLTDSSRIIAATGLSGFIPGTSSSASFNNTKKSANDKIVVGLIGARNQGMSDLVLALKQPGVECGALCDIDDNVLAEKSALVEKLQGRKPILYKDFRKLLGNKDIDAVIIGTPDHWHCYQMIAACEAGKDVYVEKPLANSIRECDVMVAAVRKYNKIVQVGQQQRSGNHWQSAMEFIKSGQIGALRKTQAWGNFNYGVGQPKVADEQVPAGIDFDMWLGPAPERTFNRARFHGSWRMFWDYGGGLMTDWGVHLLDMALWAKDISTMPIAVAASGGNFSFADRARETFDTMSVNYQLPEYTISWEHVAGTENGPWGRNYGLAFIGNDATLVIDRSSWDLLPESAGGKYKVPAMPRQNGRDAHEPHLKNWVDCIRSRKDPNCTVEMGRLTAAYTHMANIALRTNTRLVWNEGTKNFGNNHDANALLSPEYRKPWTLPKV